MSYSIWLSVEVDDEEVKPLVGIMTGRGGWHLNQGTTLPETGQNLLETRKAGEVLDKVRIFAEGLR